MLALARIQAWSILRSLGTWVVLMTALVVAWAGVSLDVFAFDHSAARISAQLVGTLEIAAVVIAIRHSALGVTSGSDGGFRSAIVQRIGPVPFELGSAIGAGLGAAAGCVPVLAIIIVLYNLYPEASGAAALLVLLGLATEAAVAAGWTALGAALVGRAAAPAIGFGTFVMARFALPLPLRALLPAPLELSPGALLSRSACATLATIGVALIAASVRREDESAA